MEHLYILYGMMWDDEHETQNSEWLDLLHLFIAVKELYLSAISTLHIAPFLQELVGERVTEVLTALQPLFIEEPLVIASETVKEDIEQLLQFAAARRLAGCPIVVSLCDFNKYKL